MAGSKPAPSEISKAPASAGQAEALPLRIGFQKAGSPFLLKSKDAQLSQALTTQNARLEWVEFQTGPALLETMRAGALDIGYVGETPPVFAQSGGVPFV